MYSFRLDPETVAFADAYAEALQTNRTVIVEALLGALREKRLWVVPDTRPNPFPGVTRPELLPVRPYPENQVVPGTYPHRYTDPTEPAVPASEWESNQENSDEG